MNCKRCRKRIKDDETSCPYCGEPVPDSTGLFQTSAVLIASGGSQTVYRSVEEVPARLRNRLLKTTNGANSATILIADRRGRQEIAKAMRSLPKPARKRLLAAILGADSPVSAGWITPLRKRLILGSVVAVALLLIVVAFLRFS